MAGESHDCYLEGMSGRRAGALSMLAGAAAALCILLLGVGGAEPSNWILSSSWVESLYLFSSHMILVHNAVSWTLKPGWA